MPLVYSKEYIKALKKAKRKHPFIEHNPDAIWALRKEIGSWCVWKATK